MKIAVLGTSYVGLVVGACLADLGNSVTCADIDAKKIESLSSGKVPFYEPGLEETVKRNSARARLSFTTDIARAVSGAEIVFIAVGTPQAENGEADLSQVKQAAETIAKAMNGYKVIVNKSTVPVGTGDLVGGIIKKHYNGEFDVVSNPEFLREGSAVNDFMQPERIVIGNGSRRAMLVMEQLYRPLNAKLIFTDIKTAELIKYASNAFLATKVSFINEVANLCDAVGADVSVVAEGMGMDSRIGSKFLRAGCGYGGSCFPKDVRALMHIARNNGTGFRILEAVDAVNDSQKKIIVKKLNSQLPDLKGKRIAVLGLSFKPNTDDMRDAPSLTVISELLKQGANVSAYDPVARGQAKKALPAGIEYADSALSAARNADAILLLTEWNEFRELPLAELAKAMKGRVLVDGRNVLERSAAEAAGFRYFGIGR